MAKNGKNRIKLSQIDVTRVPIIAGCQLSPPENKMFIFQLWLYILKAFSCVFVPFTLEIVLPYLLDLGCFFGEVISISILSGDNW